MKFEEKSDIIDKNSIKSNQSNNLDSVGTLTVYSPSKQSSPQRSPVKPIIMESFDVDEEV